MQNVIVDVDGVVANLLPVWLDIYNQKYSDDLHPREILAWETERFVKPDCGLKIYELLDTPGIYDQVKPVRGALKGIGKLRTAGLHVLFVTAGTLQGKLDWLKFHQFLLDDGDYIYCRNKNLIRADAIVDDCFENVRNYPGKGILFDAPYNRMYDWPWRARGWKQAVDLLLMENGSSGEQWK